MKTYLLVFLISASVAGRAQAEEFDAKQVPVNVQWFLHLDVGGFKKTQLGQFAPDGQALINLFGVSGLCFQKFGLCDPAGASR